MKFFAAAILAATAFAVKQDDENSQMDGNMDPMDPPMNSGMRILEAIDEDQNGEIDSWEAYEAGQFMLEAGILTEEDLITIESAFGDRDSVPIQEVAEWFEMNENEIPQDVVRMIEDEILEMAGAEMWYDALDNADSNYDGVLQRDEVEGGLRFAVDNEWMSREEADEIRDFMMMADMNGNDDEEVTMEEAFGALAMMMEDDPDMRQQMLDDAFDMIEDEQDMYAEWEEYDQSDDWENWEECPECAEWQDEMWEDEEAYCWEHGCPDIWEEDCDEGCPAWEDEEWMDDGEEGYCWEHGCPDIWEEDCDEGCPAWEDEEWMDDGEEGYCWEHGCPDIWEEDCDEGCPEA